LYTSETTTLLVVVPNEIDDVLNEWIAEQRDSTMTKSEVVNIALREWLIGHGLLDLPGPLQQVDDEMVRLVEQAFPHEPSPGDEPRQGAAEPHPTPKLLGSSERGSKGR
jgi:hypothetical protein